MAVQSLSYTFIYVILYVGCITSSQCSPYCHSKHIKIMSAHWNL